MGPQSSCMGTPLDSKYVLYTSYAYMDPLGSSIQTKPTTLARPQAECAERRPQKFDKVPGFKGLSGPRMTINMACILISVSYRGYYGIRQ